MKPFFKTTLIATGHCIQEYIVFLRNFQHACDLLSCLKMAIVEVIWMSPDIERLQNASKGLDFVNVIIQNYTTCINHTVFSYSQRCIL